MTAASGGRRLQRLWRLRQRTRGWTLSTACFSVVGIAESLGAEKSTRRSLLIDRELNDGENFAGVIEIDRIYRFSYGKAASAARNAHMQLILIVADS